MKRKTVSAVLLVLLLTAALASTAHAWFVHSRHDHMPGRCCSVECCRSPSCRRAGPGPGYLFPECGHGYRFGHRCYGWPACGPDRSAFGNTLSKGEAKKLVEWIIRWNVNLEVGGVSVVGDGYEVTVVTRKGKDLVDNIFVEKDTGYCYPVYKE